MLDLIQTNARELTGRFDLKVTRFSSQTNYQAAEREGPPTTGHLTTFNSHHLTGQLLMPPRGSQPDALKMPHPISACLIDQS